MRVEPATILVVDPDLKRRTLLIGRLRAEGHVADGAGDGFSALTRLAALRPELTILELDGSDGASTGLELFRRLRSRDPGCGVIVTAQRAVVELGLKAMREGALDCILRPCEPDEMARVVAHELTRRRLQRAPAPQVPGATLAELERHAILSTLQHTGGSTSRTAKILGISTRKVQYRLLEYGDPRAERRDAEVESETA
jgi:DNA-binding NtrC family response regulator